MSETISLQKIGINYPGLYKRVKALKKITNFDSKNITLFYEYDNPNIASINAGLYIIIDENIIITIKEKTFHIIDDYDNKYELLYCNYKYLDEVINIFKNISFNLFSDFLINRFGFEILVMNLDFDSFIVRCDIEKYDIRYKNENVIINYSIFKPFIYINNVMFIFDNTEELLEKLPLYNIDFKIRKEPNILYKLSRV